ncbi:MAG: hypothetical protein VB032_10030 [Burkholderiaceae bacterium]|nr:hypothetical protein [Burkholderiaceae bacterium]
MRPTKLYAIPRTNALNPRKVLHRVVNLSFRDSLRLQARMLDVSPSGITMMSPLQIAKGNIGDIRFDVPLNGEFPQVHAVSKSLDCVCICTQGFRTNLRFIQIDAVSKRVLSDLLRHGL